MKKLIGKHDCAMKKLLAFCVLAAIVLCGCQKETLKTDDTTEQMTFTAEIADNYDGAATKTSLDENGNVLWNRGDRISIFAGTTVNSQYQVSDDSEGKTSATLNPVSGSESGTGTEISGNVAYYPYSSSVKLTIEEAGYKISGIELPATQAYAQASFANGAFPMAAASDDTNLGFKNILGGLKLQLTGTAKIRSISVSGNDSEKLCGSANVIVSPSADPAVNLTDATATTVTLDCGTEGVQLNEDTVTPFIIALPPVTMASGFTVTVTDIYGGEMKMVTTKSQTVKRSKLLKMAAKEYQIDNSFTITSDGETSVSIAKNNSPGDISLEYRTDGGTWSEYTIGTAISLTDGASLQFRAGEGGNATFSTATTAYYKVSVSGNGTVKASGNLMSLLDRTLSATVVPWHAFCGLFINCTKLTDAADLKIPATTVGAYSFYYTFKGCTALVTAPTELPATTFTDKYCYQQMFEGCTSMTTAPAVLPATTLTEKCYYLMFSNCSKLTSAPELPATTLAKECYSEMFSGCTALTTAPTELPATTLTEKCYYRMFYKCSSLTAAPALPATTLAANCYSAMFYNCSKLTSAPELPATTLAERCYGSMFYGCTGLTTAPAKLQATTLAPYCCYNMFYGCTGLTSAPELPATTLASYCYYGMFQGCTGLTKAPVLPATTLVSQCYTSMFQSCSNLSYIKALFTTTPSTSYTKNWVKSVASSGTFVKSKAATWDVTGVNGVPSGWTVTTE